MNFFIMLAIFAIFVMSIGIIFVKHYYIFFNIDKEFENNVKIKYLCDLLLLKLINTKPKIKMFVIAHILTPIVKLNYFFTSIFIYLLSELCKNELNCISENNKRTVPLNNKKNDVNDNNKNKDDDLPPIVENNIDVFMTITNLNDMSSTNNDPTSTEQIINILNNIESDTCDENNNIKYKDNFDNCIKCNNSNDSVSTNVSTNVGANNVNNVNDYKEDISEYLLDENINMEKIKIFDNNNNKNEINEKNDVDNKQLITNQYINKDEPIESISLDEIDFGDYMGNLIKNLSDSSSENTTINKNVNMEKQKDFSVKMLQTGNIIENLSTIPTKIKIGKKKI